MSATVFALITSALVGAALLQSRKAIEAGWDWYQGLNHAENQPPRRLYSFVWLPSMLAYVAAIWSLGTADAVPKGWMITLVVLSVIGAWYWPLLIFTKHDLRNSFTLACTIWVLVALSAAGAGIFLPLAGLLMVPLLVAITAGGFYNFVVWQLN